MRVPRFHGSIIPVGPTRAFAGIIPIPQAICVIHLFQTGECWGGFKDEDSAVGKQFDRVSTFWDEVQQVRMQLSVLAWWEWNQCVTGSNEGINSRAMSDASEHTLKPTTVYD